MSKHNKVVPIREGIEPGPAKLKMQVHEEFQRCTRCEGRGVDPASPAARKASGDPIEAGDVWVCRLCEGFRHGEWCVVLVRVDRNYVIEVDRPEMAPAAAPAEDA